MFSVDDGSGYVIRSSVFSCFGGQVDGAAVAGRVGGRLLHQGKLFFYQGVGRPRYWTLLALIEHTRTRGM